MSCKLTSMHDMNYSDQYLKTLLQMTRSIAVVGASIKPARASFRVTRFLLGKGYTVFPVNPLYVGQSIHGLAIVESLSRIDDQIDMVDIFRRSEDAGESIDDAISAKAKIVWTQLDIIDFEAAERAEIAGLQVVMDRCPAIEYPRLIGT